jgi:hypothetical protein
MAGEPPPPPFRSASWSSSAISSWASVTTIGDVAYGRFVNSSNQPLYLFVQGEGSEPSDGNSWILDTVLPSWAAEHLVTNPHSLIIRNGTDAIDGTRRTVYSGTSYKLTQQFASGTPIMKATT